MTLTTTIPSGRELTIHESDVIKAGLQNIGVKSSYSRLTNKLSLSSEERRVELFCGLIEAVEVAESRVTFTLTNGRIVIAEAGKILGESQTTPEKDGWISMREAEKKYGVNRSTFSRWINSGKLEVFSNSRKYDTWLREEEVKEMVEKSGKIQYFKKEEEIRERTGQDGKMPTPEEREIEKGRKN